MNPPPSSALSAVASAASTAPEAAAALSPEQWFQREVHAHDQQLKAWLRGTYPTVENVEDIAQESYLRVWKARARKPIESAKSFLFTIARHLVLDQLRRSHISPISSVEDLAALTVGDEGRTGLDALGDAERMSLLSDALVSLPSRMREVVLLHRIQRLSQHEVAQQLGLRPKTVENLSLRGVQRCRDYLRRRGYERF